MSDLSAHHDRSLYRRRPYFGEAEIRSLVFYIASTDEPGFQLNACNLFGQELARHIGRDAVNDAFREIFHCSSSHIPERPQLQALLAFSAYFSIDLPNLLTDPALAARQTSMPFQAVMPASRPRNLSEHRGERKEWFRDKLKKAVDGPGPYLSPPKFCAANNYSYSMARHNNARLLMQLGHLWRAQEKKRKSKLHRRVVRAAIRERQRVGSDTIRRITRDIAHGSNVPLHLVRSTFKQKL